MACSKSCDRHYDASQCAVFLAATFRSHIMIMMCLVTNKVYRTMRIRVCHSDMADIGDVAVAIDLGLDGVCQLADAHHGR